MMIYIKYSLIILWRLLNICCFLIPAMIVCRFAKPTDAKTTHNNQPDIQRYRLPKWLRVFETPDEHLPGAMYEPTVKKIYDRFGWYCTSVYWIGLRNPGQGIVWNDGHEVPKKIKDMSELEKKLYGVYRKEKIIGPLKIIYGWETTRDWYSTKTTDGIWATPHFTVRWVGKGAKIN